MIEIVDEKREKVKEMKESDLPLITMSESGYYWLYAKIDNKNYVIIDLNKGDKCSDIYPSFGEMLETLGLDERIVDAQIVINR